MILVNGYNAACDSWSCCGLAAKVCVNIIEISKGKIMRQKNVGHAKCIQRGTVI